MRLWCEATNPIWRGQIVHLPDQESLLFTTLAEAEAFIQRFAPELRASQKRRGHDGEVPGDSPNSDAAVGEDG